jgi:hypothetical protein
VTRVLTALLVAASAQAMAQAPGTQAPWRAAVTPPRRGLPAVVVEVGYPGRYVPAFNTPIVIRATAGDLGFDGYIGFHFEVDGKSSIDQPVVSRAVIRPHETWTFRTIAILHSPYGRDSSFARELILDWRNRSVETVASANAGVPPWIVGVSNRMPLHAATAGPLPNFSQWYAGFSSIVIPLSMWLDLERGVRDAIFASGIEVIFIGFARADQTIDRVTHALLPVEFSAGGGTYTLPWPYGTTTANAPVSWTAKRGAGFTVSATRPYIARTLTASWVADERALDRPLPSVVHVLARSHFIGYDPRVTDRRPWPWAAAALLAAVAAWLLVRNNRLVAGAALAIAFAAATAMSRQSIRKAADSEQYVLKGSLAPGIGAEFCLQLDRGPSPLAPAPVDRFSVSGGDWLPMKAEVRTNHTSPSMGAIESWTDWGFQVRWKVKRTMSADGGEHIFQFAGNDLHSLVITESRLANDARSYLLQPELKLRGDGPAKMTVALPRGYRDRAVRISVTAAMAGGPVRLDWATGSIELPLQNETAHPGSVVIPPEVLRAIDSNGGVFEITVTPAFHIVRPVNVVLVHVQEKS